MEQFVSEYRSLKKEFGANKYMPGKYEREILIALSHYPELKNTHIQFILALHAAVPYGTKPSFMSCFLPKNKRTYTITILENAEGPTEYALLKNLDARMRIGVLGHELGHVSQYSKCSPLSLLKMLTFYLTPSFRKKTERKTDLCAISHHLGEELLEHAEYIRSIPGHVEQRPDVVKDYLQPSEIRYFLRHPEEISKAS